MQRRTASVALAVAIAIGGLLVTPTPALASSQESRFTYLTNHERSSRGLRTLQVASDLVAIARRHSEQMADRGDIYHNNNLQNEVSGNWTELGENVGKGPSVDSIHKAFMDSAPHRANILRSSFNQVGIGTVVRNGTIYVTEVFAKRGSTPRVVHHTVRRARPRVAHRAPVRPKPKPRPAQVLVESPRTISVMIRLIGLDAARVSPITGEALGI